MSDNIKGGFADQDDPAEYAQTSEDLMQSMDAAYPRQPEEDIDRAEYAPALDGEMVRVPQRAPLPRRWTPVPDGDVAEMGGIYRAEVHSNGTAARLMISLGRLGNMERVQMIEISFPPMIRLCRLEE